jgi:hypothetical protein
MERPPPPARADGLLSTGTGVVVAIAVENSPCTGADPTRNNKNFLLTIVVN